jgi:hypothetical protein
MKFHVKYSVNNPLLEKEGWPPQAVGVVTQSISKPPLVFPSLSKEGAIDSFIAH